MDKQVLNTLSKKKKIPPFQRMRNDNMVNMARKCTSIDKNIQPRLHKHSENTYTTSFEMLSIPPFFNSYFLELQNDNVLKSGNKTANININKNSSWDEIANVNFYADRPARYQNSLK